MRVIAFKEMVDGVIHLYGYGEMIGQRNPSKGPLADAKLHDTCIKLDNGRYIWGNQCFWGPLDKYEKFVKKNILKVVQCDLPENIKPVE